MDIDKAKTDATAQPLTTSRGPIHGEAEAAEPPVDVLSAIECWTELEAADLGRLAVWNGTDIDLFPVNYLVHENHVYFRSAPGNKIVDITRHPHVTFEADGTRDRYVWSVVIKGLAERVSLDSEIQDSGIDRLRSLTPTDKWNYVRISPLSISGRRFIPAYWRRATAT